MSGLLGTCGCYLAYAWLPLVSHVNSVLLCLNRLYCPSTVKGADGIHCQTPTKHDRKPTQAGFSDVTLPALTQLGLFRVGCTRAFVSLIDNGRTKIISHATIENSRGGDIGTSTLGLKAVGSACTTMDGMTDSSRVIGDLTKEDGFKRHPFVIRFQDARFYAEIPLRSSRWGTIGTYCVVDTEDRALLEDENITDLEDAAGAIVQHLENIHNMHCQVKSNRLLNTLMTVKGLPSIEHIEDDTSETHSHPESGLSEKINHLAISVQEARDLPPISTVLKPPESPFFQPHEPSLGMLQHRDNHQQHLRRCSIASNQLVTVTEKVAPSPLTCLLFSRASSLLQKAMELDGVLFLDASRSNSRR